MSIWTLIKSYWLWERLLSIVATTTNLFRNWIQKFSLYTSLFRALIISNRQASPQRELLPIDCYWEYECEWSIESFSSLKVCYYYWVLSIVTCWRDTQHKHCIYCRDSLKLSGTNSAYLYSYQLSGVSAYCGYCCLLEWHTTQVLWHLLWLIESQWNNQCLLLLLNGVSALSIIATCWRDTNHRHCIYCCDSLKLSRTNSAYLYCY